MVLASAFPLISGVSPKILGAMRIKSKIGTTLLQFLQFSSDNKGPGRGHTAYSAVFNAGFAPDAPAVGNRFGWEV
jgi:hypothetical protein